MRFHGVKYNLTADEKQELYKTVYSKVMNNGYCVSRLGGSSGTTVVDKDFIDFINKPGSLPRKMAGVKVIRTDLCWKFYYISTKTGKAAYHRYSTPKKGGKFVCTDELMDKYPFFVDFAKKKIHAAYIINAFNNFEITNQSFSIAPNAIEQEIKNVKKSIQERNSDVITIIKKYNRFNNHTLVQHPTGLHRDVFAEGCASLENKICFAIPLRSPVNNKQNITGRGGNGRNSFVFAILDWANGKNRTQRRSDHRWIVTNPFTQQGRLSVIGTY